jgi:hypothetical protein
VVCIYPYVFMSMFVSHLCVCFRVYVCKKNKRFWNVVDASRAHGVGV